MSEMKPWEHPDFNDNPEWTAADFARAVPVAGMSLSEIAAELKRTRGRPKGSLKADPKQQVTLRLDRDVIEKFRATGAGWQSRINEALRKA